MSVDGGREGVLGEARRKEIEGGVRSVTGGRLKEREGIVERPPVDVGRKEGGEDGGSLRGGRNEGGGAVKSS